MPDTVLVTGASGLVGTAMVEEFLEQDWPVVAVSRRTPEVVSTKPFTHIALDLRDANACAEALRDLGTITHVVFAAVQESEDLRAGWRDPEQMRTNLEMLVNIVDPLTRGGHLKHVTLLQGTKAYGAHIHRIALPARERQPRDQHENFYWLQEDYLREQASRAGWGWTILRPQLVIGPNIGVSMNLPPVIGAYAALRKAEGRPFGFPGGAPYVSQAVDTRILARAAAWAAGTPSAWGEHFNVTNGEVFAWREIWPALAVALGTEVGEDEPIRLAEYFGPREGLWAEIVREHGLRQNTLSQLIGHSHHLADFQFAHGRQSPPPPTLVSTVKIRQAGFCAAADTEESFVHWLRVLQHRKILPRPSGDDLANHRADQ